MLVAIPTTSLLCRIQGMSSPTQRSKKYLEEQGYFVWIVEHWNSFAKIRQDLWGFADLLAIKPNEILAVQTTSGSNVSARVKKINNHENVVKVRQAGIRIHVHGWAKGKNNRYSIRVVDCSYEHLEL